MYVTARAAMAVNRPREAIEALSGGRLASHAPRGASFYWGWLLHAEARHLVGDYEDELDLVGRAIALFPDVLIFRARQAGALIALGRVDEALAVIGEVLPMSGRSGDPGSVMLTVAYELRAHGHREEGLAMARRAVQWIESHRPAEGPSESWRVSLAEAHYAAEDWTASHELWTELEAENPEDRVVLGWLGVLAARRGQDDSCYDLSGFQRRFVPVDQVFID